MNGPVFAAVYGAVRQIPMGRVATYGQLARLLGLPRGARTVGFALAACRDPAVPCHRVVNRLGSTSAAFDVHAPGTQRALLEAEGVPFTSAGCADLTRCLWDEAGL